jgi:hypothetical protein
MPPQQPFNLDFDKEHGQDLIKTVQEHIGCFSCNKPNPSKTCSRCQVSMYCNQDCQKTDWKSSGVNAGDHKELCKYYCKIRGEEDGRKPAIPICLYFTDLICEGLFESSMRERSDLFLQELGKYQQQKDERIELSFITYVINYTEGKIRLTATVSFMVDSEKRTINDVLLESVDEGPAAEERLRQGGAGRGSISAAAEEKVLEHWVAYIGRLREISNASVSSIKYLCGLKEVANKSSFQEGSRKRMVGQSSGCHIGITGLVNYEMTQHVD